MSGLTSSSAPLTAKQIVAQLQAVGFTSAQSDAIAALLRLQLVTISVLADEGFDLPDELLAPLDDFDPDDDSSPIEGAYP